MRFEMFDQATPKPVLLVFRRHEHLPQAIAAQADRADHLVAVDGNEAIAPGHALGNSGGLGEFLEHPYRVGLIVGRVGDDDGARDEGAQSFHIIGGCAADRQRGHALSYATVLL
jgi:hypothetical protein